MPLFLDVDISKSILILKNLKFLRLKHNKRNYLENENHKPRIQREWARTCGRVITGNRCSRRHFFEASYGGKYVRVK